jgi:hypothetical protein
MAFGGDAARLNLAVRILPGSESLTGREGAVLGQNQKFGEYTTLVNISAKSPTLVNALAGNGISYHVSEVHGRKA